MSLDLPPLQYMLFPLAGVFGPGAGDRSCRHGLDEAQLAVALRETTIFVSSVFTHTFWTRSYSQARLPDQTQVSTSLFCRPQKCRIISGPSAQANDLVVYRLFSARSIATVRTANHVNTLVWLTARPDNLRYRWNCPRDSCLYDETSLRAVRALPSKVTSTAHHSSCSLSMGLCLGRVIWMRCIGANLCARGAGDHWNNPCPLRSQNWKCSQGWTRRAHGRGDVHIAHVPVPWSDHRRCCGVSAAGEINGALLREAVLQSSSLAFSRWNTVLLKSVVPCVLAISVGRLVNEHMLIQVSTWLLVDINTQSHKVLYHSGVTGCMPASPSATSMRPRSQRRPRPTKVGDLRAIDGIKFRGRLLRAYSMEVGVRTRLLVTKTRPGTCSTTWAKRGKDSATRSHYWPSFVPRWQSLQLQKPLWIGWMIKCEKDRREFPTLQEKEKNILLFGEYLWL